MASVTVRVDEDTKAEATAILDGLGLDLSSATRAFYRQVILRRGLPFQVVLPDSHVSPAIEQRFVAAEERMRSGADALKDPAEFFNKLGI
ncbi:MAG: type II toxin-antitoxin system RelB/DinJ family antitoxin [Propionibacteriaceae bacterium]|nr:type II toxin-antitoxin system RelB/DinJ family antitoxin [Propionibacteriaceae bacterium]